MPSGYVGINTRTPTTDLDVNGDTKISGNLELGTITNVEQKIIDISNNAGGGVPSITYDAVTETTTFDGSFVIIPSDISFELGLIPNLYSYILALNSRTSWLENTGQGLQINNNTIIEENLGSRSSQLSIRPVDDVENAVQEIYSKNGIATLKLGDDNAGTLTFSNILKSENGNATFYGNNSGETKFMEYNSTDDKINISKDMDLGGNILYIDNLYIQETTGTAPSGQKGSLTLIHDDVGGTSSIVFRSARDSGIDHGYISYQDDYDGSTTLDRSLLEIGCKNDSGTNTIDNIALMPSGFVGINTRTPEYMLDISAGDMRIHGVLLEQRPSEPYGYGVCLRTTLNPPDTSGAIFEVRSSDATFPTIPGNCRLFCGQALTSSAKNPFCFGYNGTDGEEAISTKYTGKLDLDGSVDCTEVKVKSIPLNSFFNFTYGYNYTPNSHNFGKGRHIVVDSSTLNETYSHFVTFDRTNENFTCKAQYLGTYEIQAHVTYRNTSGSRHNPCIAIGVDDDVVDGTIGSTGTSPNWLTSITNSYSQHNIFSAQYVRMSEGKVTTLSCTRIYHFTNTTDKININTFMEIAGGNDFDEEAGAYVIINAGISFKYIGNFENIT